jgi:hypothetical protein
MSHYLLAVGMVAPIVPVSLSRGSPVDTDERVAIIGSRGFAARWKVEEYIDELAHDTVIVSGGAPGVDTWAHEYALKCEHPTELYRADWQEHGKKAGYLRNQLIVSKVDRVVAFWDGVSKGTKHTIDLALKSGVDLEVRFA